MKRLRWEPIEILTMVAIAAILLVIVAGVVWNIRHPCVRSEERPATCGGDMHCMWEGEHGCTMWTVSPTYACTETVCLERKR